MMRNAAKRVLLAMSVMAAGACPGWAADAPATMLVQSVRQDADGITVRMSAGVLKLQVWGERVVRVEYAAAETLPVKKSLVVVEKRPAVKWTYRHTADAEIVSTGSMEARVNAKTGAVGFYDAAGELMAEESAAGRAVESAGRVTQDFQLADGEGIYGLGQHQAGVWNYRGKSVHLQQENREIGVPVWVSSRGYGVLWDNASVTDVEAGVAARKERLRVSSEVGDGVDYYFLGGGDAGMTDAIAEYRGLSGAAPMFGEWAFGLWQCKERYQTQQELLGIAAEYRKRQIPLDGIIQDWQYWKMDTWGSHQFDPARYPDPAAMVKQLHDEHLHMLISIWPKFDVGTPNIAELEKAGGMYEQVIPYVFPKGKGKWYDPFNPQGRAVYWSQISRNLLSLGIDGWWLDASEPELSGKWGEYRHFKTAAGPGAAVFNAYPLMHTTAVYEGQRADAPDKRVLILTRSAYAGQQRNAAISWSGDIHGDWKTFAHQIPAGLNFSVSGIPYWNTDIGGFFSGKTDDPKYRELFTRWFEFGAFCPMFRVHGSGVNKELWRFGEETQKTLVQYDDLRYRLMPYIYSVAWQVTSAGATMMRPLVMDFREDAAVKDIGDQYLFGPALLVNPVTKAGTISRSVYLPEGTSWVDFWTGEEMPGGAEVEAAAPLEKMPLFVRAGSIVPLGPVVQYARERLDAPLEVRVYRGADGTFTLYEDEGDTYHYEHGAYSTIRFGWDEKKGMLTIGKRAGAFPGMIEKREFRIVWVGKGHGAGIGEETKADRVISYDGSEVRVAAPRG